MRPDTRLQRLQPRLGDGWRERLGAQREIVKQRRGDQQREQQPAQQGRRRHVAEGRGEHVLNASTTMAVSASTAVRSLIVGQRAKPWRQRVQDEQYDKQWRLDHRRHLHPGV